MADARASVRRLYWVLGTGTQVTMFVQVTLSTEPSPLPFFFFFFFFPTAIKEKKAMDLRVSKERWFIGRGRGRKQKGGNDVTLL